MRRPAPPFLIALVALSAAACSDPDRGPGAASGRSAPRTVVVVSIDTLRSDRLPAWGYAAGATPAIDALARESVRFERAFAEIPLTLPSHASIFTGRIPPRHGVRDNLGFALESAPPADVATLAERFRDAGYATFGAVSSVALARRTGIARGFDGWDEPVPGADPKAGAERAGSETLAAAIAWIDRADPSGDRRRLLFVHFYEPHAPWRAPEPFRSRFADPYDGEVAAADALVGELVAALRARSLWDDALVVLLSDHGEGLGDHGEEEHGLLLYREALQVPLLVKLPRGERAGETVARNVALVDVAPTLLELAALPPMAGPDGRSLFDAGAPADRPLYAETYYPLLHFGWGELVSVVAGDLHLVSDGAGRREELFRFPADPGETTDLRAIERRPAAEMRRALDAVDRAIAAPAPVDAETAARLGALGYLGRNALPDDRAMLDDPRDRVRDLAPLLAGLRELRSGDPGDAAKAVESLRAATKIPGAEAQAFGLLAEAYDSLGEKREAAEAMARAVAVGGGSASLAESAAARLLELGRAAAAADLLGGAIARAATADASRGRTTPEEGARLRVLRSRALLQLGRPEDAAREAEAAVREAPDLADARYQRAVLALARDDVAAAIPDLERAAALDPKHVPSRKALALVRYRSGDLAGARALLEEVLARDPDDADARDGLALLDRRPDP